MTNTTARLGTAVARLATSAVICLLGSDVRGEPAVRWVVCYSDRPEAAQFGPYDVVVLDARHHPPLETMQRPGRTVFAYIPLMELGRAHDEFPGLVRDGAVLDPHPAWTGSHYVDVRHPAWTRAVLDRIVPQAIAAGFNGLFLDTLDDAAFLEGQDAERYGGTREAAVRLVRAIRQQYPSVSIMANRGYDLMPDIANAIDILLGESVLTTFDADRKGYARRSDADIAWQVQALRHAQALNPAIRVFTLDYWDPSDAEGLRRIYREQRANGFSPYVSTPMLDAVVEEPR